MFPALRSNGIARWLAVVLALYGLAAGLLLCLALSEGLKRGRALRSERSGARVEESRPGEALVTTGLLAPRTAK